MAVIVVIVNHRGEVLLTRRAKEKDLCPGWWENTGGSVLPGRPPWRPSSGSSGRRRHPRPAGGADPAPPGKLPHRHPLRHLRPHLGGGGRGHPLPARGDRRRPLAPRKDWEQVAGTQGTLCPARRAAYRQELFRRLERYCQGWREFPPMEGPAPERWDLYDKDRNPLGRTVERGAPLPPGAYHLAVQIVPLDSSGQASSPAGRTANQNTPASGRSPGAAPKRGRTLPPRLPGASGGDRHPRPAGGADPAGPAATPHRHLDVYAVTKDVPLSRLTLQPGETAPPSTSPWRSGWPKWAAATTCPPAGSPPWTPPISPSCASTWPGNVILQLRSDTNMAYTVGMVSLGCAKTRWTARCSWPP